MTPDLICGNCHSPRLERLDRERDRLGWWSTYECADCGATGETEHRHDGLWKYHGAVTTPRRADLRELSAQARRGA